MNTIRISNRNAHSDSLIPASTATSPGSDAADPQAVPSPLLFYRGASTQSAVESLQLVSLSPMKHSPARSPDKLSRAGSSSHSPVRGPSADRQLSRSSQAKLLPALPPPDQPSQPSQPTGAEGLGGRSVGASAAGGACSVSSSLVRAPVAAPVAAESEASEPAQAVCCRS